MKRISCRRILLLAIMPLLLASLLHAANPKRSDEEEGLHLDASAGKPLQPPMAIEQAWAALPAYKFGQSRACCAAIEQARRESFGKPEARAQLSAKLIATLETAGITVDARNFILRELRFLAPEAAAPALAKLLGDESSSHLARAALEAIPAPAAAQALRDSLPALQGDLLAGVINSLGARKDAGAVAPLGALLKNESGAIRAAAAAALGKIGGQSAAAALLAAHATASPADRAALANAALECAESMLASGQTEDAAGVYEQLNQPQAAMLTRIGALRGLVRARGEKAVGLVIDALLSNDAAWQRAAADCVKDVTGPAATDALVSVLPKLAHQSKAVVLLGLAARGGKQALPAAVKYAREASDADVHLAAVQAVSSLGDASVLALLLEQAAASAGDIQAAARQGLENLPGDDVNAKLMGLLETAAPPLQAEALRALAARRVVQAAPAALKLASSAEKPVRIAAIKAMTAIGGAAEAQPLVTLLAKGGSADERDRLEAAIVATSRQIAADKDACAAPALAALSGADAATKGSLLRVLARILGPKAIAALRAAVADPDRDTSDTAVRALADAPDPAVSDDLLALAQSAGRPNQKILALRGYIRLSGNDSIPDEQKIARLKTALSLCTRAEEKKLVLGVLGQVPTAPSLAMVDALLDEPSLGREAAAAAISIAQDFKTDKALVKKVLTRVIAIAKEPGIKRDAEKLLGINPPKKTK